MSARRPRGGGGGDKRRDQVGRGVGTTRGGGGANRTRPRPQEEPASNRRTPIILAKPVSEKDKEFPALQSSQPQPPQQAEESKRQTPETKQVLLSRKDSPSQPQEPRATDSPKPKEAVKTSDVTKRVPNRIVKLVDEQQFSENLADYMTDNPDFIVVGVLGHQGVGKSTILNSLLNSGRTPEVVDEATVNGNPSNNAANIFPVQSFEKQMLSEHCTNGISAWVSPQRIIYLDTNALFSISVLDRAIQLEKKYSSEFNVAENTVIIHSLQTIGYLLNICHVVLVVQDGAICDPDLLEYIKMAETLKPSSPALSSFDESTQMVDYSPEVIFVQNKAHLSDVTDNSSARLSDIYKNKFDSTSVMRFKSGLCGNKCDVNLSIIPDIEAEGMRTDFSKGGPLHNRAIIELRQMIARIQPRPFTNNLKQSEKTWFQHAQKAWDQVKTTNFYLEYSRLLR
jgi:protein SMG9